MNISCVIVLQIKLGILRNTLLFNVQMWLICPERSVSPSTKSNQEQLVGKQSGMSQF